MPTRQIYRNKEILKAESKKKKLGKPKAESKNRNMNREPSPNFRL
jgi:hypothetical protein